MPLIRISVNRKLTFQQQNAIKNQLGNLITIIPGKKEESLMLHFEENQIMYFRGTDEACIMSEITLYKEAPAKEKQMFLTELSNLFTTVTQIPENRQYACFIEHETFGVGSKLI